MTALSDLIRQLASTRQTSVDRAEPYDELLKRSSLLTSFDADIYDRLLSTGLPPRQTPAPSFKTFIVHRDVAPLPNSDGQFYIRPQRRKAYLGQWLEIPEERRKFSKRLVQYYQEKESDIDVFAQRIFADSSQALKDFRRLYSEADKRFDLAMCETLLRILRNRSEALTPALTKALNNREEYFQSRSRFADDWARTTHFLPRNSLTRAFERFLQGRKRWIFHMHAAGGVGKTAYLRWLISRYCVVERGRARTRIPVARIDFDHVHLAEIDRAPWLVLLPIADQLSVQLPGNPFKIFLKEFGEHQKLVDRPAGRSSLPFSSRETPEVAGLEESALHQFTDALAGHRALLVFDTLEEVVLHHGATLISMLDLLGRLHARRPQVSVVLSGRYDIRERDRFAEVVRRFGRRMVVVPVKPFTRAQSLEYLVKMRSLRPDASVRNSDLPARGNPFKLALFADLLGKPDTFSREDLKRFPKLEINYLIERIILRIPDDQQPLRWALRYAVIPHDLTKEFLVTVLGPHLEAEIAKARPDPLDRPLEKLPEGSEIVKETESWKHYQGVINYDTLWDDLLRYHSPSGWITVEHKIPKLQPDIVVPMRQLLQTQDIFEALQGDAAVYFERRANDQEEHPQEWADMTVEAIYHRFQQRGADAADFWEQCLLHPNCGDPEIRRKIAQTVLSSDFLGDDGKALRHVKTETIISRETLAKAFFELADIDAQKAPFADARNTLMRQAQQNLNVLARIERSLDKRLIPIEQRAFVEASVDIHARRFKSGLAKIEQGLALDTEGTYRIPLLLLKADMSSRNNPAEAGPAYDMAVDLTERQPHPAIPYSDILGRRANFRYYRGDLRGAANDHRAAIGQLRKGRALGDLLLAHLQALFSIVRLLTDPQQLEEVIAFGKSIGSDDPRLAAFVHRTEVYRLIDQYRMLEAKTSSFQLDGSSAPPETEILRGMLATIFFDFDQALASFDRAENEWKKARRPDSAAWCRLRNAEIAVEDIGNLHYARTLLSRSQTGRYFPAQTELLNIRLLVRKGTLGQARKRWRALRKRIFREAFTGIEERAWAFASAIALEIEERSSFGEFLTMLTRIEPPSARFRGLGPFRHFNGTGPRDEGFAKQLMELLGSEVHADDPNSAHRVLLVSDALRFLGDRAQAVSLLDAALKATPRDRIFLRRQFIKAQQRLDVAVDNPVIQELIADVDSLAGDCRQFRDAVRLEQAEWWIKKQQFDAAADALPEEPREQTERSLRYWLARAELSRHSGKRPPDYFLKRAAVAARKLGLPLRNQRSPAAPRNTLGQAEDVLQIDATKSSTTIQYFPAKGDRLASSSHSRLLASILAAEDSTQVAAHLAGRQDARKELADLFEFLGHPQTAKEDADLCIVTADSLAGIPWEWAFAGRPWRFVYRGLERGGFRNEANRWTQAILNQLGLLESVDGVTGRRTIEALRKADEKHHILEDGWGGIKTKYALRRLLPRSPVLLIGMPAEEERSYKRGYGSIGIHLEKTYQEMGVDLIRADMEKLDWPRPLPVIHITLDFSHTVGEIRVGGGSSGRTTTPWEFTARMLTKLIADSQGGLMKPFVILDPWHPGHPIELARQQYLRNAFAYELLQLGGVRGVLATGLVEPPRVEPCLRGLIGGLHDFDSAGAIAARLRMGVAPAALFTEDPTIPVI
jgi:hypothetical protein